MKTLIGFIVFLFGVIIWIVCSSIETNSEKQEIYQAWQAANPSHPINRRHFDVLRENDLLPGVDYATKAAKNAEANAAAAAVMSGAAMGMSAGK